MFGVLGEFGVFGVFTVLGVFGVLTVFTSPLEVEPCVPVDGVVVEVEPCVPVDGVVVGVGAGVDVLVTATRWFSNDSIDETPAFEPVVSWMLMALAVATAPPLRSPTPSTEAAPTATHLFFFTIVFRSTSRGTYVPLGAVRLS